MDGRLSVDRASSGENIDNSPQSVIKKKADPGEEHRGEETVARRPSHALAMPLPPAPPPPTTMQIGNPSGSGLPSPPLPPPPPPPTAPKTPAEKMDEMKKKLGSHGVESYLGEG